MEAVCALYVKIALRYSLTGGVRSGLKNISEKIRLLLLAASILAAVFIIGGFFFSGDPLTVKDTLSHVMIRGEYRTEGGNWRPLSDLPDFYGRENLRPIYIRGHFSEEIEKNRIVMLRMLNVRLRLSVNGREIYSFGYAEKPNRYINSPGDVWHGFVSPGITPRDEVTIELRRVYAKDYDSPVRLLLENIYAGDKGELLLEVLYKRIGLLFFIGIFVPLLGLAELLASPLLFFFASKKIFLRFFYNAGFTFAAGGWIAINYDISTLLVPFPRVILAFEVICLYLASFFFTSYASTYMSGWRKRAAELCAAGGLSIFIMIAALAWGGITDLYRPMAFSTGVNIAIFLFAVISLVLEYKKTGDRTILPVLLSSVPALLGGIMDDLSYWQAVETPPIWVCMSFSLFITIQSVILIWEYKRGADAAARAERMEKELTESKVSVMLSQIEPHFIYNSLSTIKALCVKDPETAAEAVSHFAKYLRRNMDSLTEKRLIPFEEELSHLDNYFYLEKLRFRGLVELVYDLKTTNFMLPVLTLQPLAENAVRHGRSGGRKAITITVATERLADGWLLTVSDNGSGFDLEASIKGSGHLGLESTRKRVEYLCNGRLSVSSVPGIGTSVAIFIPYEGSY